jgi:hypothetical protein
MDVTDMEVPQMIDELQQILGSKLVAYIASVYETRIIHLWSKQGIPVDVYDEVFPRLRLAYEVASMINAVEGREITQAWFQGLNPLLGDCSAARLLREGKINQTNLDLLGIDLVGAAKAFLANS